MRLIHTIKCVRSTSANEIQRLWRGFRTRAVSKDSKDRVLLRWRHSGATADIYVAGEFSRWAKWRMKYCPFVREHRLSFPLRLIAGQPFFHYKFIVDGLWTCDGSLPMVEDDNGIVNNVYHTKRSFRKHTLHLPHVSEKSHHLESAESRHSKMLAAGMPSKASKPPRDRLPPPTRVKSLKPK